MRKRLILIVGVLTILARMSAADAGIISDYAYEYQVIHAANYTEAGHTDPGASAESYFSVNGLDGLTYSSTVSAAGSTSSGSSNLGAPNANTVVMTRSWNSSRAAADAPEAQAIYGNNTYSASSFWFTAEEGLTYSISGHFNNSDGNTIFQLLLFDRTSPHSPGWLYYTSQSSLSPGPSYFEAGGLGGPGTFPLTGMLEKGRVYEFGHQTWSYGKDGGATASGEAMLTLSRLNPVPEPASLTLFGLGALGLAAGRKRLRRRP
jgi:hypothetical protein